MLNNPVRYTDPTGFLTEDQIMRYLGVATWEEVLHMFGKGGRFAGEWGWLEAMRAADLGENIYFTAGMAALLQNGISAYSRFASSEALANASSFVGHFVEAEGEILFVNNANQQVTDAAQVVKQSPHRGYTVTHPLRNGQERIRRYEIERHRQYQHLRSVDWNEALNPVELADMAKVVVSPALTGALTVTFFATGAALCTSVVGCAAGGELVIAGGGAGIGAYSAEIEKKL